ncbi:Uncharacterised protein [Mycobacteroides abscessus subsp. abscessus]|nr:Uncharacterised protein [Mycobacteroides abscessus subsp. abscessus]
MRSSAPTHSGRDSRWENHSVSTSAASTSRIAATRESSALSTAVEPATSDSTSSAFARAVLSIEPNTPEWAVPTASSTAMSGRMRLVR